MADRISAETRQIDDGEFRREVHQARKVGAAQHIADEYCVPCQLAKDARVELVGWIGAGVQILDEQFARRRVRLEILKQQIELRCRHCLIVVPP